MKRIYLVRHGQDADNAAGLLNGRDDDELTALGRNQALAAAQSLADAEIKKIFVSPMRRCQETARIISGELGLVEPEIMSELNERDFGVFTRKPVADIPRLSSDYIAVGEVLYFLSGEGVETFPEVYKRAESVLAKIERMDSDADVLIVTHGDFGKMFRAAFNGQSWEEGLRSPFIGNAEVIALTRT